MNYFKSPHFQQTSKGGWGWHVVSKCVTLLYIGKIFYFYDFPRVPLPFLHSSLCTRLKWQNNWGKGHFSIAYSPFYDIQSTCPWRNLPTRMAKKMHSFLSYLFSEAQVSIIDFKEVATPAKLWRSDILKSMRNNSTVLADKHTNYPIIGYPIIRNRCSIDLHQLMWRKSIQQKISWRQHGIA